MSSMHSYARAMVIVASLAAATIAPLADAQTPLGTSFTYQGVLKSGGNTYSGTADVQFRLYDVASGGIGIGGTLSYSGLAISDGLITASLNFGSTAFDGNERWLEIAVRAPAGSGAFNTLTPRQKLAATPYALTSLTAINALNASISGAQPNQVSLSNAANTFTGAALNIDSGTLFVDDANNRLGIGTFGPSHTLTINSPSSSDAMRLMGPGSYGTDARINFEDAVGNVYLHNDIDGGLTINTNQGLGGRLALMGSNVGIGTATPTAKLDVIGTVKADALSIATTTRRLAVPIAAFNPSSNATTYGRGAVLYVTGAEYTVWSFQAPACLPDGATITRLDVQAFDNTGGPSQHLNVYIGYVQDGEPAALNFIANVQSNDSGTVQSLSDTTILSPVVDNLHRSYAVYADFITPANPLNLYLSRVVITYTVTSPLP